MSLEKLLERIADALEANAKAQAEHTEALKKYVLKVEGGQVSAPADDEKAKAKAKAKPSDEDEDEDEEEESTAKGKKAGKGKKATKPAKGKKAGKAKPSDEDEEDDEDEDDEDSDDDDEDDDDDDDEEAGKPIKIGDIRDVLVELKDVTGKKGAAKEILKEFGYDELGDADPRDFKALMAAAQKALAKAKKKK